jgi:voltage-gated potassium channel
MLRRKPQRPAWISVGWRAGAVLGLLLLMILFHWLERGSLVDELDGHVSFTDVIYFTMISATTTGYGDIVPVTDRARMFDALVVTPVRIFFILIFVGTAYTFVLRRTWDRWIMARLQRRLTDHIVVAGFGTSGSKAVAELIARGTDPAQIVVIDINEAALERAENLGCITVDADASRDGTLEAVRVAAAKLMIVSAGRDDSSILICLTARHLAPDLRISVAIRAEDNELIARQAGANIVINPVSFTGLLLAGAAHGPKLSDYLADLASTHGRVHLAERTVSASECGKPLSAIATGLGVRIYRKGRPIGFWEPGAASLEAEDRIVEIVPSVQSEAAPIG